MQAAVRVQVCVRQVQVAVSVQVCVFSGDDLAHSNQHTSSKLQSSFGIRLKPTHLASSCCADNEWNPPGHGDIYPSLLGSGMLDKMLSAGIKYLFVSNRYGRALAAQACLVQQCDSAVMQQLLHKSA